MTEWKCLICGGVEYKPIAISEVAPLLSCTQCSAVFTDPEKFTSSLPVSSTVGKHCSWGCTNCGKIIGSEHNPYPCPYCGSAQERSST